MFSQLAFVALALALLAETPTAGGAAPHPAAPRPPATSCATPDLPRPRTGIRRSNRSRSRRRTCGRLARLRQRRHQHNVGYVEARIQNYNLAMHADGPGHFSLAYTVPWWLPPWLRRSYTLQIVARSVDGVEAVHPIGIRVR